MESRSDIVQKLLYVAEHKEQCFDFEMQLWLEKYEQCKHERINFSEAAFLIISAAKIYGHKFDYLEQMVLEFNRRSAADFKATAKDIPNDDDDEEDAESKEKAAAEKEKEKLQKRQKRLLKLSQKIEFSPKQFTIAAHSQISLNIHEPRTDMDDEDYEQLRMKNVFPRINILQSNLQNNSSFYDNLGIIEKNCDNLDSLRDYRIFMDTIDEPLDLGMANGDGSNGNGLSSTIKNRGNEKHFNAYVSAEHIKEKYGVEMPDNSDYLNMLKYGEEIERLNLRKLTIEQLGQLKVGTYLNNILHGNKQDCIIPEADSGMGESLCDSAHEQSTLTDPSLNTTSASTDQSMSEPSVCEPSVCESSACEPSACEPSMSESSVCDPSASEPSIGDPSGSEPSLSDPSASEPSLSDQSIGDPNTSMESSTATDASDQMDTSHSDESAILDASFEEKFGEHRNSLDDGLGSSLMLSPVQMAELDAFERSMLNPVVEVHDIFYPMNKFVEMPNDFTVDLKDPMNDMLDPPKEPKIEAPVLYYNIFQIPEKMVRKPKLFQLTEDFDLWVAQRKRKAGCADDTAPKGKMLKLSSGAFVRTDPNSDDEELLGFDPEMEMRLQRRISIADSPPAIPNRSSSSCSETVDKNATASDIGLNASTDMAETLTDQSTLNISGEHQTGNSTEICNDTLASTTDQLDSGCGEMLNSTENETLNASTQESDDVSPTCNIELIPPELVSTLNDDTPDVCDETQTQQGEYRFGGNHNRLCQCADTNLCRFSPFFPCRR